jgi:hypothetical protein
MENLKERIAQEVKKLGAIKHTDTDYKMTKYSSEDVIEATTQVVSEYANELAVKFNDWIQDSKWSKVSEDCYLHSVKRIKVNGKQLLELFINYKS